MPGLEQMGLEALNRNWSFITCTAEKEPLRAWKRYQTERPTRQDLNRWVNDPTKKPDCLAVVTGAISGLIVLDFDGEAGQKLVETFGLLPHVRTGSGGYHVYFKHPGHLVKTLNSKSKKALGDEFPGLDIRADGGYAIFTGRSTKGEYTALRDWDELYTVDVLPAEVQQALGLVLVPETVKDPATVQKPTPSRIDQSHSQVSRGSSELGERKLTEAIAKAAQDGRNNAGVWLATQLRDNRVSETDALRLMRSYQESVTGLLDGHGEATPYTWDEACATLRGIYTTPARDPEAQKPLKLPTLRSRSLFDSMYSLGQLLAQPDKGWYLEGMIGPQELVMIAGESGAGKTFLVLDLCMSLALGKDWARTFKFEAPEPLRVAYFAGEGVGRLKQRVQALISAYDVSLEQVGDRFQVFGDVPNLASLDDPTSVLRLVEEYRERGLPLPQVVVIDTLARAIPGSDENSARDAGQVIAALDYLKNELGCAVIVVHHTGKSGDSERGSSAFKGAMDALFKVKKTDSGGSFEAGKIKDAEDFNPIDFSLMPSAESCCVGWGKGAAKPDPIFDMLNDQQGQRFDLNEVHSGLDTQKTEQTTRKALDSLVSRGKVKTEKEGKKAVWWVPKDLRINLKPKNVPLPEAPSETLGQPRRKL